MGIFRKYMTVEELAPELLVEKEMTTVHKTFITYIHHIKVFVDWQKENDVNVPIRKITKEQIVTMPQQLIELCYEYGIDKADRNLYIFGPKKTYGAKAVSENMLRYRFNQFRAGLDLPKGYKFYSFKHTGASMLHKSGISMRELMDQLRHTRLAATEHYLKKHCGIINERIKYNFPDPLKDAI